MLKNEYKSNPQKYLFFSTKIMAKSKFIEKVNENPEIIEILSVFSNFLNSNEKLKSLEYITEKIFKKELLNENEMEFKPVNKDGCPIRFITFMRINDYVRIKDERYNTPIKFKSGKDGFYYMYKKTTRTKFRKNGIDYLVSIYMDGSAIPEHIIEPKFDKKGKRKTGYEFKRYDDWKVFNYVFQKHKKKEFVSTQQITSELIELGCKIKVISPKINSALEQNGFERLYKEGVTGSDKRWMINGKKTIIYKNKKKNGDLQKFIEKLRNGRKR